MRQLYAAAASADRQLVRIFLDANIQFSACKSGGAVRELLNKLRRAGHTLCADAHVLAEARRNLERKDAGHLAELDAMQKELETAPFGGDELPPKLASHLPEKDRLVLAAAIRMRCDALVTGDRTHFGELYSRRIGGVAVYSPRLLAEALLE